MNRADYMDALSRALDGFDEATRRDILLEIEDHLAELAEARPGISEEELVAGLERPEALAEALKSEGGASPGPSGDSEKPGHRGARITIDGTDLEEALRKAFDIARLFKTRRDDRRPSGSFADSEGLRGAAGAAGTACDSDHFEARWKASGIDTVRLQTKSADIRIFLSVDELEFSAEGCEGVPIRISDDEKGTFDIKTGSSRGDADFLELRVPSSIPNLVISTASGDVSIADRIGNLTISTASGDVEVESCCGSLTLSTASGDAKISACTEALRAETASGSLDLELDEQTSEVAASSVSGDLKICYPSDLDATFTWATLSGDVECDAERSGPRTARSGLGLVPVRLSTVSGDISISRL